MLDKKEWVKVLDAFAKLHICDKDENLEKEGDFAYYFDLEDGLLIDETVLAEVATQLDSKVSILTRDAGNPKETDQLLIYFEE